MCCARDRLMCRARGRLIWRSRSRAMCRSNSVPQLAPRDGGRGLRSSCRSSRPKLFIGLLEIDALEAWQLRVREAGDSSTLWTRVHRRSWHLADLPLSAGCPGVKGPVPQPVSMSCCSVNGSRSAGGRSTACDPRRTTERFVHFYMVGAGTSRLESAALSARDQVSASQATSAAARSPPTRAPP